MNSYRRSRPIQVAILVWSLYWSSLVVRAETKTASKLGAESPQLLTKVPAVDTLIVPGKRAGTITSTTTANDLAKIFGIQRLSPKKFYGAEGQVEFPATLITLGKNRFVTVVWKDAKKRQPWAVIINDPTWKTASGIGVGMSLAKLRQVLGEFKITGLGWDYGNQAIELSPAMQARYTGLSIVMDADELAARQFPDKLLAVSGDGVTIAASDPRWKSLKMYVSTLSIYFADRSSNASK